MKYKLTYPNLTCHFLAGCEVGMRQMTQKHVKEERGTPPPLSMSLVSPCDPYTKFNTNDFS